MVGALGVSPSSTLKPYLKAFDGSGNLLATVSYPGTIPTTGEGSWQWLTISRAQNDIASVVFGSQFSTGATHVYGEFDNFSAQ